MRGTAAEVSALKLCPECQAAGLKSMVYPGMGWTTLVYCQPHYDENGRYHHHDSNTTRSEMKCSQGHVWQEATSGSCWCGWPKAGDEK